VDEANRGAFAEASAAPRASAVSGSSGAVTASAVAVCNPDLIGAMSTPEPTTNKPFGQVSRDSKPATISVSSAVTSSLFSSSLCTSVIEPSAASTTANVAHPGSMKSIAMRS